MFNTEQQESTVTLISRSANRILVKMEEGVMILNRRIITSVNAESHFLAITANKVRNLYQMSFLNKI